MMKGMKLICIAIAALMVVGVFGAVTMASAQATFGQKIADPKAIEFGPEMRERTGVLPNSQPSLASC
jgi:hypothetical protein